MLKKSLLLLVWVLTLGVLPAGASSSSANQAYLRLMSLTPEQLMRKGDSYLHQNRIDSALACYEIVSNRYDQRQPDTANVACVHAMIDLAMVYTIYYNNYAKATDLLLRAQVAAGSNSALYDLATQSMGGIYFSVAEMTGDRKMMSLALQCFRKVFRPTLARKDYNEVNNLMSNMLSIALHNPDVGISKEWALYKNLDTGDFRPFHRYNVIAHNGLLAFRKGDISGAARYYGEASDLFKGQKRAAVFRFWANALIQKSYVLMKGGRYAEAIATIDTILVREARYKMNDIKTDCYKQLATYYRGAGRPATADHYDLLCYRLNDQMLAFQQVEGVYSAQLSHQLATHAEHERQQQAQHRRQMAIIAILALFIVVIGFFLIAVIRKDRKLQASNRALYARNQELLRLDDDRQKLIKERGSNMPLTGNNAHVEKTDSSEPRSQKESTIGEERAVQLYEQILLVMQDRTAVCSPDFSMSTLVTRTQSNRNYVSQVIRDRYGTGFAQMLSDYRVRYAQRMMADREHYGQYTVEAISTEVGFRSRTSFTQAFKRVTGLTPSDYYKMAVAEE